MLSAFLMKIPETDKLALGLACPASLLAETNSSGCRLHAEEDEGVVPRAIDRRCGLGVEVAGVAIGGMASLGVLVDSWELM